MIVNAVSVSLRQSKQFIDLFAGIGGLSQEMQKSWKRNSVRISAERDGSIWEHQDVLGEWDEAYFPNWEEEVVGIEPRQRCSIELDLTVDTRMTKALLVRNIVRFFRKRGCPCQRDFIGRIEVLVKESESERERSYRRYTIQPRYDDQIAGGWQLDVAQGRVAVVSKLATDEFEMPERGFDVVAGTEVVSYAKLTDRHWARLRGTFYPIANAKIAPIIGVHPRKEMETNKYRSKLDAVSNFIKTWIYTQDFIEETGLEFPNGNVFIQLPQERVMMVPDEAMDLVYGDQYVGRSPKTDFKNHGPIKRPDEAYRYFFISRDDAASDKARMRLYNILENGYDYEGKWSDATPEQQACARNMGMKLKQYLWQSTIWEGGLSMTYKDNHTAIAEIETQLKGTKIKSGNKYFAIIISNIRKDEQNTRLRNLYFEMKELLMKYGITSQVIYINNLNAAHFEWYVPNIAAAIVGKEKGMAWGVKSLSAGNDMIVGIGASKQPGIKNPYLGSAFCFNKEGQFRNFAFCRANDAEALQSSLKGAIWSFCDEYGKPDRLIIHYYKKKLKREESERIENMLRQCGIQCPIYVVNVVTAVNEDLIGFDTRFPDCMPPSGTYVHLRGTDFLLYNNERYAGTMGKVKILYPIKISVSLGSGNNTGGVLPKQDANDIITQVYQFCRLYWKSVNMQNIPITTAYPELVAAYVPHFRNEELPEFGRHNLWML